VYHTAEPQLYVSQRPATRSKNPPESTAACCRALGPRAQQVIRAHTPKHTASAGAGCANSNAAVHVHVPGCIGTRSGGKNYPHGCSSTAKRTSHPRSRRNATNTNASNTKPHASLLLRERDGGIGCYTDQYCPVTAQLLPSCCPFTAQLLPSYCPAQITTKSCVLQGGDRHSAAHLQQLCLSAAPTCCRPTRRAGWAGGALPYTCTNPTITILQHVVRMDPFPR
jgi:hypothetical protein